MRFTSAGRGYLNKHPDAARVMQKIAGSDERFIPIKARFPDKIISARSSTANNTAFAKDNFGLVSEPYNYG